MRICYVAYQFWPSVGGSQAQAEKQAGLLSQLGQEVLGCDAPPSEGMASQRNI